MKRILAIDGGGIKGVFPAAFLASLEETHGEPIARSFDLIAGTSTGGIIALGLGLGFSAREILSFYQEYGPRIFPTSGRIERGKRLLRQVFTSKYESRHLREALETTFGDRRLGESTSRLVIPSLNIEICEPYIYKTAHHVRFTHDYKQRAVDVALATSAAPTYFSTHSATSGVPLIDGGLYANNPTGMAVVEGIGVLGWSKEEIKVLSLSCTTEPLDRKHLRRPRLGIRHWLRPATEVFMIAQSHASMGTASVLLGHENVMRICPVVPPGHFAIDSVHEVQSLAGLGSSEARKAWPTIKTTFLSQPADPFEPFHRLP
jgi:patatin-like phospholipase/acyl hydrolase